MSNKTQNAKKAKTASARKSGFVWLIYLAIGIFALLALFLMPPSIRLVSKSACFAGSCVRLEQAASSARREKGLSGRESLASREGMIFIFDEADEQCMWMKGMKFNIDMLWIDENNKVIKIVRDVSPDTYPDSFCAGSSKYVIELGSGMAASLGVNIGDLVQL